jgi:beta-ribofuranosylaminobenzene 5'-phosphate synthase
MKISVEAPGRLHLTLIDLNGSLGRIDGGIGIALEKPSVSVEIQKYGALKISAGERSRELLELCRKIAGKYGIRGKYSLKVKQQIPLHSGLGSTTPLYMAAARALLELNGIQATDNELALLTGRGGTSGIGVAAFQYGGFIVDCGHSFGKLGEKKSFLPSSYSKAKPSPVACRLQFPHWEIILCIPEGRGLHGANELKYFQKQFPVKEQEAEKISRIVLMKLIPSVIEKNLVEFDESIKLINQARSFEFPKETQKIIREINRHGGMATSMSSFGPTVFTFTDNHKTKEKIKHKLKKYGQIIETKALNHGAVVAKNR